MQPDNLNDPLFLASRLLDGDVSPEERREIEALLRESPQLQAELDGMRRAEELVRRALGASIEMDWEAHRAGVRRQLDSEASPSQDGAPVLATHSDSGDSDADERLDAILSGWAASAPHVDSERFVAEVHGRLRRSVPRRSLSYRVIRLAAPLAAAAAVGIVVLMGLRPGPESAATNESTRTVVRIGPSSMVVSPAPSEATVVVAFDRSSRESAGTWSGGVGMTVVSAAEPAAGAATPLPPI